MLQHWFNTAKLGIFIHYGIYAVKGIPESWSFYNGEISYEEYMAQCDGFTAERYDPQQWAALFSEAGARYAILTTKHHDGVALWDTDTSDLTVVKKTPAARDLIAPYCEALRDHNIKVGLYFSHLDWSHPDYPTLIHPPPYYTPLDKRNPFSDPIRDEDVDYARWENFLRFHRAQLRELCERFSPDLFWFDGNWGRDVEQWRMAELREQVHRWAGGVVLNSRMNGYGDYQTPEQGLPITRPSGAWEFSMTMNDSWGHQPHDNNYKPLQRIIRIFCHCIGMGGNLLLDIAPYADGSIPPPAVERLQGLGAWIRKHEEAVYAAKDGLPHGHFNGPTALSPDRRTLYLYLVDKPQTEIAVKGLHNQVKQVRVVGHHDTLPHEANGGAPWVNIPGIVYIDVPDALKDEHVTVLALELDRELDLYHGPGQAIEAN
jgi:alpha-L-fucosidase